MVSFKLKFLWYYNMLTKIIKNLLRNKMHLSKYQYKRKKPMKNYNQNEEQRPSEDQNQKIPKVNKSKSKVNANKNNEEFDPKTTLTKIIQWRKNNLAPVDQLGCERQYDKNESEMVWKYQLLISIFLSVQTKDETTHKVMIRLRNYGLNPLNIMNTSEQKILQLISQVNFNKKKASRIHEITQKIIHMGRTPNTLEQLLTFSGIGLKIANIYLKVAEGINSGIGVDTHVHRISNRLKWVDTKNPNQTEMQLQKKFDQKDWPDMNIALVGFGQTICDAKKPKCNKCCVKDRCPQFKNVFSKTYQELF